MFFWKINEVCELNKEIMNKHLGKVDWMTQVFKYIKLSALAQTDLEF